MNGAERTAQVHAGDNVAAAVRCDWAPVERTPEMPTVARLTTGVLRTEG